ncbi:hypothetical protein Lal_00019530 [Lupinus albus]|uniref:DUF7787 domain-containing protein n=1 Tax=Lupinus albus TaxID=3870 RepID=A0A6A4R4S8_LUPAL|nr:hypothetical protein Lalb_Chr01g0005971 [Lupinus albus]KAF1899402.1 hypothetical protein Lal_00019530 [Lupinus albus]
MESQVKHSAISSKKRTSKNEKLCLDDYLPFLHSRQTFHLTMNQLNQIIRIHGFKKIHHAPKKALSDAVETLDLVDLSRSTLNENVSAFAILSLEDVIADLSELNWQECCVTSLEKLSTWNESFFPGSSNQNNTTFQLADHFESQKTHLTPKTLHLTPRSRILKATKMVPRRKRSNIHSGDGSTVDSVSLASC